MVSAAVVTGTDQATLQPFVVERTEPGATVYTDDHGAYLGLPGVKHQTVRHSVGEYVDGKRTRTASRASGACSSVATMALTIR